MLWAVGIDPFALYPVPPEGWMPPRVWSGRPGCVSGCVVICRAPCHHSRDSRANGQFLHSCTWPVTAGGAAAAPWLFQRSIFRKTQSYKCVQIAYVSCSCLPRVRVCKTFSQRFSIIGRCGRGRHLIWSLDIRFLLIHLRAPKCGGRARHRAESPQSHIANSSSVPGSEFLLK